MIWHTPHFRKPPYPNIYHHYTYIHTYIYILCIYILWYIMIYIYIIIHILWCIYIYYNTYIMMYIYILYYSKSLAKPPPKTYPRLRSHLGCSKPCHLLHSSTRSDLSPRHDLNLTRWWFPDLTHTLLPWENDNNSNPGASEASFPKKNLVYRCHVQKLQKTSVG
jgi:hypothetical protein